MSRLEATRLVIARELHESLRRKAIWIVAAILALGSTAAVVLPEILGGDSDSRTVGIVGAPSDEFGATLREVASGIDIEIELVPFDDSRCGDERSARRRCRRRCRARHRPRGHRDANRRRRSARVAPAPGDRNHVGGRRADGRRPHPRRDRCCVRQRRPDGRGARHGTRRTPRCGLRDRRSCCTSCCCCSRRKWRVVWRSRRPTA